MVHRGDSRVKGGVFVILLWVRLDGLIRLCRL